MLNQKKPASEYVKVTAYRIEQTVGCPPYDFIFSNEMYSMLRLV